MTIYEAGLHACGHHRNASFSEDSEGFYEPIVATCQACAVAEAAHAEQAELEKRTERPHRGRVLMIASTQRPGERIRPWRPTAP